MEGEASLIGMPDQRKPATTSLTREAADDLLAAALAQHRQGRLEEAERLYRALLEARPDEAEALHGLGCIAHAAGRPDIAIGLIGQAVAHAPQVAAFGVSLGLALLARGHLEEARAALHVAVLREPGLVEGHRAHAQALLRLGRAAEAEASLRRAAALAPREAPIRLALGQLLQSAGRLDEALDSLRAATELDPWAPLAWHALAALRGARGETAAAELAFRKVAGLLPQDAAAAANLGSALWARGQYEAALAEFTRSLGLAPDVAASLSGLGLVLMALARPLAAEARLAEAARLAPQDPSVAINHATALAALERDDEAERVLEGVLARHPAQPEARFNRAALRLARGARRSGWRDFEARRQLPGAAPGSSLTEWQGEARHDGAVLLRAEQGLGDGLMFLRWLPLAAGRAPLVAALPAPLLRLARQSGLPADCVPLETLDAADPPGCVAQAGLLSLPALLEAPDPPPPVPLRVDRLEAEAWRAALAGEPARLRVGVVWAGSGAYRFDRARSLPLGRLSPLARVRDVLFVCLQQGPEAAAAPPDGMRLWRPDPPPADLAATAALIAGLDLVIGVDTAVVHLTGSLGVPVWLLDRFGGDWRWRRGFAHGQAWYPGLRRFAPGCASDGADGWDGVLEAVADELERFAASPVLS